MGQWLLSEIVVLVVTVVVIVIVVVIIALLWAHVVVVVVMCSCSSLVAVVVIDFDVSAYVINIMPAHRINIIFIYPINRTKYFVPHIIVLA